MSDGAPVTARIISTAEVVCTGRTQLSDGQYRLGFSPDWRPGANSEWAKNLPNMSLAWVVRREVGERFRMDGHYTLLFTEADAGAFQ